MEPEIPVCRGVEVPVCRGAEEVLATAEAASRGSVCSVRDGTSPLQPAISSSCKSRSSGRAWGIFFRDSSIGINESKRVKKHCKLTKYSGNDDENRGKPRKARFNRETRTGALPVRQCAIWPNAGMLCTGLSNAPVKWPIGAFAYQDGFGSQGDAELTEDVALHGSCQPQNVGASGAT